MKSSTSRCLMSVWQTCHLVRIAFPWMLLLLFAAPVTTHAAQHPVDRTDYGNYVMFPVPLDATGQPVVDANTGQPDSTNPVPMSWSSPTVSLSGSFSVGGIGRGDEDGWGWANGSLHLTGDVHSGVCDTAPGEVINSVSVAVDGIDAGDGAYPVSFTKAAKGGGARPYAYAGHFDITVPLTRIRDGSHEVAVSVVEPSHGGFGTATATLEIKVTGTGPTLSCAATVTADADNTQEACFPLVLCVQAPQATISTQQFTVALDGGAGGTTMAHVIKVGAPTMSRTRSLAHRS